LDLWRITTNAPNRDGRGGGTAVFKFYELWDNLSEYDDQHKKEQQQHANCWSETE
jgi:hypothetical protein